MSRIGNRVLTIPEGVTVKVENGLVTVTGPKGELSLNLNANISVSVENAEVKVARNSEIKKTKQIHGTTNALIANMIEGVSKGYEKALEIIGVGYRFNVKGKELEINAGYSHKVNLAIPEGITVIREVRKPEPYKGKGIRYKGEHIRRKEGKKASK